MKSGVPALDFVRCPVSAGQQRRGSWFGLLQSGPRVVAAFDHLTSTGHCATRADYPVTQ